TGRRIRKCTLTASLSAAWTLSRRWSNLASSRAYSGEAAPVRWRRRYYRRCETVIWRRRRRRRRRRCYRCHPETTTTTLHPETTTPQNATTADRGALQSASPDDPMHACTHTGPPGQQ